MAVKLKACPFCGNSARVVQRVTRSSGTNMIYVACCVCGAASKALFSDEGDMNKLARDSELYQIAIERWNRRAGEESLTGGDIDD